MKAYTSLEQSEKLAEILPLESADHHYVKKSYVSSMMDNKKSPYGEKINFGYFEEESADKVRPKFKVGDRV